MMKKFTLFLLLVVSGLASAAQAPTVYTSSDIFLGIKKLKVLGSVLYMAAHPDDENTRLLAYLAKDRLYRTGYLSLTRGDGGQNLIGDEQGIDLGLIRTQELLAARRIDGAEQFFSTAYDFGFSKTTEEALQIWDRNKVLADAVWVIRKFQPDVIITRFPPDSRAGHGHHSGSAVIAHEAFIAAADPSKFPEQFKFGIKPWKVKRIVWNSFLGGGNDNKTITLDVGAYNSLLGKSYGEIAALSRSQHKSQGFGVSGSRGAQMEAFLHTDGEQAKSDVMDGVDVSWKRVAGGEAIGAAIDEVIKNYSLTDPSLSIPALVKVYKMLDNLQDPYWKKLKQNEVAGLIEAASGIWMEATTTTPFAVQGDSIRVQVVINNRMGVSASIASVLIDSISKKLDSKLEKNSNVTVAENIPVSASRPLSQPYWLEEQMSEGSFNVSDQNKIGMPENLAAMYATFYLTIDGVNFVFPKPVRYKFTDPVKGEIWQPINIVPAATISTDPGILVFRKDENKPVEFTVRVNVNKNIENYKAKITTRLTHSSKNFNDSAFSLTKGLWKDYLFQIDNTMMPRAEQDVLR
ncbi:MAG: PIG-L family deacetylase, partial [Flavitalea sp.]